MGHHNHFRGSKFISGKGKTIADFLPQVGLRLFNDGASTLNVLRWPP